LQRSFPDYPFEPAYFDLDGIRMHYVDIGPKSAEPVVMLHGNPTWSYYYRKLAIALADRHRVIVPDHIGMGLSDKPSDDRYPYRLARRVDDLARLLDQLGIGESYSLVVHDWGGTIGLAYATRLPERLKRLVVLNTAAFRMPAGKRLPWQLTLCRTPVVGALAVRGFNAFARGAAKHAVVRPLPPHVREAYLIPYDTWKNRRAVLRFVEDIPLKSGEPSYAIVAETERGLDHIHCPKLICWGMRDFVFDADYLSEWTRRFPSAEVHRFDNAGHYVLEDASEEIIPLVQRFLAPTSAETR
jgi:haloalkane dehalogenase